jgi:hypothetical protein
LFIFADIKTLEVKTRFIMATHSAWQHVFKVGDLVIKKSEQVVPCECVITKIGKLNYGMGVFIKEFYLTHLYSDETFVCTADSLEYVRSEPYFDFDFDSVLSPDTQEWKTRSKIMYRNREFAEKKQTLTQMGVLQQMGEPEASTSSATGCYNQNSNTEVKRRAQTLTQMGFLENMPVTPFVLESGFEGATQAIRQELDTPLVVDSGFEGATQVIRQELDTSFVVDSGFEGATQVIRQELDTPFVVESGFEGATQVIQHELDIPFVSDCPFEGDMADILEELDRSFTADV